MRISETYAEKWRQFLQPSERPWNNVIWKQCWKYYECFPGKIVWQCAQLSPYLYDYHVTQLAFHSAFCCEKVLSVVLTSSFLAQPGLHRGPQNDHEASCRGYQAEQHLILTFFLSIKQWTSFWIQGLRVWLFAYDSSSSVWVCHLSSYMINQTVKLESTERKHHLSIYWIFFIGNNSHGKNGTKWSFWIYKQTHS